MDSITAELDFLHRCIEALKNENYSLIRENDSLRNENSNLKNLLEKAGVGYQKLNAYSVPEAAGFNNQPPPYIRNQIPGNIPKNNISVMSEDDVQCYFNYFRGRVDVFSRRWVSRKTGKAGYYPQCSNSMKPLCPKKSGKSVKCSACSHRMWTPLTPAIIRQHLTGAKPDSSDVIGVYPVLQDGTCRFLVFDFDNHASGDEADDSANTDDSWRGEVAALREIGRQNQVPMLVERSRSGRGGHVWIFFEKPVTAALARKFGFALLEKGAESVSLQSFRFYDRMIPAQDSLNEGELGNLIALPLQGQALKNGNSAFVDENWNVYPDQMARLRSVRKISEEMIYSLLNQWNTASDDLFANINPSSNDVPEIKPVSRSKKAAAKKSPVLQDASENPWERRRAFHAEDVAGILGITLVNRIYIKTDNLKPRIQNQIRRMAAFSNPVYYRNQAIGLSNYANSRIIYLGADEGGYICLPRGLRDQLQERCRQANIPYAVTDKRTAGRKLGIAFRGKLLDNQENAVNTLLKHDCGILCAATGFGKTVLCCSIIARIKLPALVILESSALLDQWVAALDSFLDIREPLPQYKTKTGLIKTRKSVIGTIHGGRDTSAGIIDVAMPGSLYKKGMFHERLREYGLILVDECHHSAAGILRSVLEEVSAKFVYGVTATPFRGDGLERINEMLLGGIRFRYTAMEKAQEMGIPQWVIPRFTRTVCPTELDTRDIFKFYELVSSDEIRNRQIADDIRMCVADGRTPVVLTNFRNHAGQLYDLLRDAADYVFLLTGDLKKDEQNTIRQQMNAVTAAETMILIATGNLIGEGFDFPRLDTLIMATPVSFKGRVEQYAGRLNRYYEGKKDVRIYDYIDVNITVFERMYLRRFKTYKRIGYEIYSNVPSARQEANAIFDADNYSSVYEKDLRESSFSIVISSPTLSGEKVFHMLDVLKPRQEAGVMVTVVTWHPDYYRYGHDVNRNNLLERIKNSGISIAYAKNGCKHYAVIDNEVVWYGSINLLSKESDDDGMMRIVNKKIAAELLEVTFRKDEYVWC